mgnify:CR=1 FL=1
MRLFDVLGPVMIGPSSSHTAGAARIGYTAQKLLGEIPVQADIGLYGSFATTGKGHGTDKALVAGLPVLATAVCGYAHYIEEAEGGRVVAEFELALSTGHSSFAYDPDHNEGGAPNRTYNDKTQVKLAFNPGAAVYIFPNVCATISFGLGGIQYTSITQKDADGNKIGSRKASNMRFRLNIAAINFGMTIHLWDKKKQ